MSKKKAKGKKGKFIDIAIIFGVPSMGIETKKNNRQKLSHGGQPYFMGNAYPSPDTDRISRGGGAAFAGVKFRGVK